MNRSLAVTAMVAMAVSLYLFSGIIGDLNTWADWDKPKEVAHMIEAIAAGLAAGLSMLGVDLPKLLASFKGGGQ